MKAIRLKSFKDDFERLPAEVQQQAKEKFRLFRDDPQHPSLRIKKMKGYEDMWEGHVTLEIVFTFTWDKDESTGEPIAVFRRIGTHEVYRKPFGGD